MIRQIWRALFPTYKCGWCQDTGVIGGPGAIARCHYCRDINAEVRAAKKKFWEQFGTYVKESKP